MDNLTHSLFGWTIARAGLGRRVPYATATLILASNAPDVDIVAGFRSGVDYLAAHRGPTHGPLGAIGLSFITAGIISGWASFRSRSDSPPHARQHFLRWWLVAMVGIVCHVLMDLPTSYGTRMLSPFVWTWYAFDWMPIIDVYLWAVLILAIVVGSKAWPRRAAFIALGFMAFDYSARAVLHERALGNGAAFDAEGRASACAAAPTFVEHAGSVENAPAGQDTCIEAAALPTFFSPLTWRIIRQYPHSYELSDRRLFTNQRETSSLRLESDDGPSLTRVRHTRPGAVYFDFARFPIAQISSPRPTLTTVRLLDARFFAILAATKDATTGARLSVVVTLDESGRLVEERFGN